MRRLAVDIVKLLMRDALNIAPHGHRCRRGRSARAWGESLILGA
jgi:hypothetical protein